jgi:hypothetical protein
MDCTCLGGDFSYLGFIQQPLGSDAHWGEIAIWRCKKCGRRWLRYEYAVEAFSGSGRWYMGLIAPEAAAALKPEQAQAFLEKLGWYYAGGSHFQGSVTKRSGPLDLWP